MVAQCYFGGGKFRAPLIRSNEEAVFVNELIFRLYILKHHYERYQAPIKHLKMRFVSRKNEFEMFC